MGKEFEHGSVAFFDLQHGLKIALYSRDDLAWDAGVTWSDAAVTELAIGHNVRSRAEVDEVMEVAKKAGARITKLAEEKAWGGYGGYFQEP